MKMSNKEKVLHGLSSCGTDYGIPNICEVTECPYREDKAWCVHGLAHDAGMLIAELLKAQEPKIITKQYFENNQDCDSAGTLPAWVEYRRDDEEWADYWSGTNDGWELVHQHDFESEAWRCWTARPTEAQREAVSWQESEDGYR